MDYHWQAINRVTKTKSSVAGESSRVGHHPVQAHWGSSGLFELKSKSYNMPADIPSSKQKNDTLNPLIKETHFRMKSSCCTVGIALIGQDAN